MIDFLQKNVTEEKIIKNIETPFRIVFFRIYDRKIASGELSFTEIGMSRDDFISLCVDKDHELSREAIINLCIKLRLNKEEAIELIKSAGYDLLDK